MRPALCDGRSMASYIVRRLLALIPTLTVASIIVFSVVRLILGDVLNLMRTNNMYAAASDDVRAQHSLK